MLGKLKRAFIPHKYNDYRPHAIRNKWLSIYTIGLIVSHFAFGLAFYTGPTTANEVNVTNSIYSLTNSARTQRNIQALTQNQKLADAAYAKLTDMFQKNYWDHVSPVGTEAWYFIENKGYDYQCAGENLAKGFSNANSVFNAWMSSPAHRANILDARHNEIGVAVGTGNLYGKTTTVIVQLFGTQKVYAEPQKVVTEPAVPEPAAPVTEVVEPPKQLTLGEKTDIPTISLYNATSATKLPYLALWAFIFVLMLLDFAMLKKAGAHKLHPHRFHFHSTLTLSIFFFVLLAVGVASIA